RQCRRSHSPRRGRRFSRFSRRLMALAGLQRRRQCHLYRRRSDVGRWLASAARGALNTGITGQGGGSAMFCHYRVRGAGRGLTALSALCLAGASLIAGCGDFKKTIGLEQTLPDEFAVESRAPLTIPPDFDLRPPQPGASRPQEKSADQQAEQIIEQAGPGGPGKQAPDVRLRSAENGLPNIGGNSQTPDPSG